MNSTLLDSRLINLVETSTPHEYVDATKKEQCMPNADFARLMMAVLDRGLPFRFQATGFSMAPFIYNGDIITITPSNKKLGLGEIAVLINPSDQHLVVHRVVEKYRGRYLIKGDNTQKTDGYVSKSDIFGVVARIEHNGKSRTVGLGRERVLIAFLSKLGLLKGSLVLLRPFIGSIKRYYL